MTWRLDDKYTKSLLHLNGADTSTTITDESGKSWTANANAQIDTAQSKLGGASCYFDGTGDYLNTADHADWYLDDGSNSNLWTVDFWVRFNGDPGAATNVGLVQQYADNGNFWAIYLNNNQLRFQLRVAAANTVLIDQAWNPADATWYHVALVKNGTSGYMHFIDGTQSGSTTVDTSVMSDFAGELRVGMITTGTGATGYLTGWIDELRISKGVARWVSNFTPPTKAYQPAGVIAHIAQH